MAVASAARHAAQEAAPRAHWQGTIWFFVLLLVTVAYQAVYCHAVTRGDPTGLFFTGSIFQRPPGVDGFVYPGPGYDGQMYRLVAHDPSGGKGYWKFLDDPRYRSRRGLVPLAAALLGGGSPRLVDLSFIAITDILLAMGGVCFVRLAKGFCPPLAAVAAYLLIPAVVASTDRMVLDGALVAGCLAAWLFYRDGRTGPLMGVLMLLPLARETGICVTGGVCLAYLAARKYRHAAAALVTAAPALSWWLFVAQRTPPSPGATLLSVPLIPQFMRLFTPFDRPIAGPVRVVLETLDFVACVCLLIAFAWFIKVLLDGLRSRHLDYEILLVLPLWALAAFASSRSIMVDPYAFMRVNSPLLVWTALRMMRTRPLYAALYVPAASAALVIYRARPIFEFIVH